ncbi:MAG: efflux RND transporter periplasmic adaptor subunit [Armatimonadetes bacterium]|nr:efflux RND transporter periplasmic adaptor subunit [Armatimonadota bacterium]
MKRICWLPILVLLAGCGAKESATAEPEAPKEEQAHKDVVLSADAAKIAGIVVEPVREVSLQAELKVPGVVTHTAQGRGVVTPPVEGKVLKLYATVGDTVGQGQPLALIESAGLAEAVSGVTGAQTLRQSAEADLRKAASELQLTRAKLSAAQGVLARQKELAKAGAFSQPSVQQAERERNEAQSEFDSAGKEETVHRAQLERAERLYKLELISRTELEQARLEVEQDAIKQDKAKKQIDLAEKVLEREKQIAAKGILNAREVQAAEAEVRAAGLEVDRGKIGVEAAKSAVVSASRGVQNAKSHYAALGGRGNSVSGSTLTLSSPLAGVVATRKVNVGQALERTTELFEIDNLQSVWVTAQVPERQIAQVRKGATVTLTTTAFKGRVFSGVVQVVGSRLDPHSRTMPVQCLVHNAGGALRPDMFAQVNLGVGNASQALVVAKDAVVTEGDTSFVYVAESEGKYEKRNVQTGRTQGGLVEILGGLKVGERVVAKGAFVVQSQAKKDELKGEE